MLLKQFEAKSFKPGFFKLSLPRDLRAEAIGSKTPCLVVANGQVREILSRYPFCGPSGLLIDLGPFTSQVLRPTPPCLMEGPVESPKRFWGRVESYPPGGILGPNGLFSWAPMVVFVVMGGPGSNCSGHEP